MSTDLQPSPPTLNRSLDRPPLRWQDRWISLWHYYPKQMKIAFLFTAQYPFAAIFWLLSLVVEPVIYLVVWTTVANEQGGEIGGYTAAGFAAYYIAWTIVRVMNISLTPWAFEWRVRNGQWSPMLLRPIHPIHQDIAYFMGLKFLDTLRLVPISVLLAFLFKPALNPTWWQLLAFIVAIFTGFLLRSLWLWALGLITFWITRISAVFELYFAIELILSGRIVPIDLLPVWAQTLSNWLPYQWSFGFPIELILGRLTPQEMLAGFGMQLLWASIAIGFISVLWRYGVRQYSAVGA